MGLSKVNMSPWNQRWQSSLFSYLLLLWFVVQCSDNFCSQLIRFHMSWTFRCLGNTEVKTSDADYAVQIYDKDHVCAHILHDTITLTTSDSDNEFNVRLKRSHIRPTFTISAILRVAILHSHWTMDTAVARTLLKFAHTRTTLHASRGAFSTPLQRACVVCRAFQLDYGRFVPMHFRSRERNDHTTQLNRELRTQVSDTSKSAS